MFLVELTYTLRLIKQILNTTDVCFSYIASTQEDNNDVTFWNIQLIRHRLWCVPRAKLPVIQHTDLDSVNRQPHREHIVYHSRI